MKTILLLTLLLVATQVAHAQCAPPTIAPILPVFNSTVNGTVLIRFNATPGCNPIVAGAAHLDVLGSCGAGDAGCIGIDYQAPYAIVWDTTTASNGSHNLKIEVYDQVDNNASYNIPVTVNNPATEPDNTAPEAFLQYPIDGTTLGRLQSVTVQGAYADNFAVVKVELILNGKLYSSSTTAPFAIAVNTKKRGRYQFQARAIDAAGNKTLSQIVTVTK